MLLTSARRFSRGCLEETSEAIWRIPKRMVSWRPYELDVSKTEAELADDALLEGARRRDYGKSGSQF